MQEDTVDKAKLSVRAVLNFNVILWSVRNCDGVILSWSLVVVVVVAAATATIFRQYFADK